MRFKDKVAIITGGSAGMGKAAAVGFAREGAKVVINARGEERLEEAAAEIRSFGGTVTIAKGDVTLKETAYEVVSRTLELYGRVDIMFNYVGGTPNLTPFGKFMNEDEDYWDQMYHLNLKSTMRFCRLVLDPMVKQKYGKIINTSALSGRIAGPNMVLYSAMKHGVIGFTKALSQEFYSYNINVNCLAPGTIDTPGFRQMFSGPGRQGPPPGEGDKPEKNPGGVMVRIGTPEEAASAVLYLASDEASYVTGQTVSVDGGMSLV